MAQRHQLGRERENVMTSQLYIILWKAVVLTPHPQDYCKDKIRILTKAFCKFHANIIVFPE